MAFTHISLAELLRSKSLIVLFALITHYVLHSTEWDNSVFLLLRIWAVTFGGIAAITYMADQRADAISTTVQITATVTSLYFGVLVTSILLYRGFFHRLGKVGELASHLSLSFFIAFFHAIFILN